MRAIRQRWVAVAAVAATAALVSGSRANRTPRASASEPVQARLTRPSLTPFQARKATTLLQGKLPCLGCHRLGGDGGVIGPDLSAVGSRRSLDFIAAMIADPATTWPGTVMPRIPMPGSQLSLIARYLASLEGEGATGSEAPPAARAEVAPREPAALYGRYCAPCHGAEGAGDGFNARHLPTPPTAHSDSATMAARPDDSLYDAIAAGGYVMNKSNRMPGFGHTLTPVEIRGLVGHLRMLCRCAGPAWSRDGGPPAR